MEIMDSDNTIKSALNKLKNPINLGQFAIKGFDIIIKGQFFDFVKECEQYGLNVDTKRSVYIGYAWSKPKSLMRAIAVKHILVVSPAIGNIEYENILAECKKQFNQD